MTFIYGHSRSPTPTPTPTRTFRPNPHVQAGKNGEGEWEYIVGVNGVQMLHLLGLISHIWLSLSASQSVPQCFLCVLHVVHFRFPSSWPPFHGLNHGAFRANVTFVCLSTGVESLLHHATFTPHDLESNPKANLTERNNI